MQLFKFWRRNLNIQFWSLVPLIWLVGILVALLSIWGFLAIADEVLEQETIVADWFVLQALQSIHTPVLNRLVIGITTLGEPKWLLGMGLIIAGILLWQRQRLEAFILTVVVTGGISLNYLLKNFFSRDRPTLDEVLISAKYYSFPSGHAMESLIVYGFLSYLLISRYRQWQYFILAGVIFLILLIGASRLYLGVHWFTDVLGGYAAGLVWLLIGILCAEVITTYFARRKQVNSTED